MRKIIILILFISSLFSGVDKYYDNLRVNQGMIDTVKRFQYLKTQKTNFDPSRYKNLQQDIIKDVEDIDTKLINSLDNYTGDGYMNKLEYKTMVKKVLRARRFLKSNKYSEYILFLTSNTVPNSTYMNTLHSVGILQENGVKIQTKQYLIGFPNDFEEYMNNKQTYINKLSKKERGYILNNFEIKVDPRLFKLFNVKKVPAIVYGICEGKNPGKENCEFKYLIHGDTSLSNFFDKIGEIEPRYKKYHEYLIGNKIIHEQKRILDE